MINGNHWVTVVSFGASATGACEVICVDSLQPVGSGKGSDDLLARLFTLFETSDELDLVHARSYRQTPDGQACGPLACAAAALACHLGPNGIRLLANVKFDEAAVRLWLLDCVQSQTIKPPPYVQLADKEHHPDPVPTARLDRPRHLKPRRHVRGPSSPPPPPGKRHRGGVQAFHAGVVNHKSNCWINSLLHLFAEIPSFARALRPPGVCLCGILNCPVLPNLLSEAIDAVRPLQSAVPDRPAPRRATYDPRALLGAITAHLSRGR